ncbi:MAG: methylenetetrahydrofolate reductase [Victivallaceae bacterium]|nr:methylenetetrahydrofolate reductase [Victivallaceae bacterium]
MKISNIYTNKPKPVLSFEIFPPKKDSELENIDPTLDILAELHPDFISVTFGAAGSTNRNRTIALAKKIKDQYGIEPLVHLTCFCYSKQEIDEFARQLMDEGLENILALRGDRSPQVPAKDDFAHASDLVSYLKSKYDFTVAGACYPEIHPESADRVSEIRNLRKKVDAGAEFLLSQLFFGNDRFYRHLEDCRLSGIEIPVIPGIMPVINAALIQKMITICGATLTDGLERIIRKFGENRDALFDAGLYYAINQIIDLLAHDVRGIHLYTMNNPAVARRICDGIRNIVG